MGKLANRWEEAELTQILANFSITALEDPKMKHQPVSYLWEPGLKPEASLPQAGSFFKVLHFIF